MIIGIIQVEVHASQTMAPAGVELETPASEPDALIQPLLSF